jgi:hypothetical protein
VFPYLSLLIPIGLVAPLVSWMTQSS